MTKDEQMEFDVLRYAGIPSLPDAWKEGDPIWVRAVARTVTRTMGRSYAIVLNNYGKDPKVIKSFGDTGIAAIESVHPYMFLPPSLLPDARTLDSLRRFVAKSYGVEFAKVAKLGREDLLKLTYGHCIRLCNEQENAKAARIRQAEMQKAEEAERLRKLENRIRNGNEDDE